MFFLTLDLLLLPHEVSVIRFMGQPLAMLHVIDDDSYGGRTLLKDAAEPKYLFS